MPGEVIDRAYVAIEPLFKNFGAETKAGITKSMGGVSTSVKSTLGGVEKDAGGYGKRIGKSLSGGIKSAFEAVGGKKLVGLLAVGGIIEGGKKAIDTFESVTKESLGLQRVMGGTVKSASEWRGAMQLGGVSNQQFMTSIRTMSKQVLAATSGKKSAFGALGVGVKDAHGQLKSMDVLLPELSDKFKTMAPGAAKNALAMQLFGRSGLQMLPFLNRGSAGMEELKKKADSLGIVIGDKQAAQFKKSVVAQRELKAGVQGLQIWFGERLVPALDHVFEIMNQYVIPALRQVTKVIGATAGVVRDSVKWFAENAKVIGIVAGVIFTLLLPALSAWAVAQAVSLGESIALWTMYKAQAIAGAARAVVAYTMTSAAAIGAAATSVATFAVMVAKWVWLGVQSLLAAAKVAAAWLIAMGPIALVIAAVVGLVVVIVKNWTTIKNFTLAVWSAIVGFVRDHWKLIVIILTGGLGALVIFIVTHWTAIVNFIKLVWTTVVNWIRDHWKLIVLILTAGMIALVVFIITKWTAIKNAIVNAIQLVINFIVTFPGKIKNIFAAALTWLVSAGRNIGTGLWNGIKAIWTSVTTWMSGRKQALINTMLGAGAWLIQVGRNVLTGLWTGIKAVWSSIVNWFKNLPGKILDAIGVHSPPKWAVEAGKWIVKGFLKGLGSAGAINQWFGKLAPGLGQALRGVGAGIDLGKMIGGTNIGVPLNQNAAQAQAYARMLMPAFGWDLGQFPPLVALWNGESGWRWNALNRSSGAYGIPQSLPANKMASAGADWLTSAATQIRWGLNYIKGRYGSPGNAYGAWLSRSPHWYKQGAWRIPSDQLAFLHKGESVAPAPVAEKWRQSDGPGGAVDAAAIGLAVAGALAGAEFRFDADGIARIVTRQQAARANKGVRR